ncbi:MAG: FAD-binding protein, partial [Quisquiliibacterium sp.]
FQYTAALLLRYLRDRLRFTRGTRLVMGNALVARLYLSLLKQGVPVMFKTLVTELVMDAGKVVGVLAQSQGKTLRLVATRGVMLATGGFGGNPRLRQQLMPAPVPKHSFAPPANTADGIALGLSAGALLDEEGQRPGVFWAPASVTQRKDGTEGVYPHLLLDRAKPGLIAVNSAGRRFVNEACSYHDFVLAMYASHEKVPTMPAYLICESGFVAKYGLGNVHPGTTDLSKAQDSGYLVVAGSLAELAQKLDIDPQALAQTVERHNALARQGKDIDFGKGESELDLFNGDPQHSPNPCLAPIASGPFVALAVWPAEIATSAGLLANRDGQLLDSAGKAIQGLYAIGNDMASVMAGTYPGPGTTIGPAMTFAYRAAMHAAGTPVPVREIGPS